MTGPSSWRRSSRSSRSFRSSRSSRSSRSARSARSSRPVVPAGRSRRAPAPTEPGLEGVALGVAGSLVAAAGWWWLTSELAGWTTRGRWPRLPLALLGSALAALPTRFADPRLAWPAPLGTGLPGPFGFYAWGAAVVALGAASVVAARAALAAPARGGPARRRFAPRGGRSGWARRADIRCILIRRPGHQGRVVLGRTGRSGRLVATEARHSVLVIGPTQSGKTSGLAIPALLEWDGPVVATSVKDDLGDRTLGWRSEAGPCWVFDPTGSSKLTPLARWSPLSGCATWSDAQKMAGWLVESTPGRRGLADAAFWYATAAKQLGPLLLASERAGGDMGDVVRWTNSGTFDEPTRLLELSGEADAALALEACAGRDERIRSSVATTLETVLAPFEDPVVAGSTAASDVDVADLLKARGTLYLCGPSHEQNRVQGLFAGLVSAVVAAAVARVVETGRPLDPPLLLVLDEVANIAPIRDLDTLASTGAGLGVQLVTVCQDMAQLAVRYDAERARTIVNNHRAKLLLSGVSDLSTLDLMSGLAGEHCVQEESVTYDLRDGRRTRSTSAVVRRVAPTDVLRRTPPGEGVLVYGHLPPARLRLRPWYGDRGLRGRAGAAPQPS